MPWRYAASRCGHPDGILQIKVADEPMKVVGMDTEQACSFGVVSMSFFQSILD
jgi:hypothetical protein